MGEHQELRSWRLAASPRLVAVAVLFAIWAMAVALRLAVLQIYQHDDLEALARRQSTSVEEEPAQRGDIVDRHGRVLAYTVDEDTLGVDPSKLEDPRQATTQLCDALGDCSVAERAQLEQRLSQKKRQFESVRPWVTEVQASRVAALKIGGIRLEKKPRRYYPHKELAAHVLGYVGIDKTARAGLEARYDRQLTGTPGHVLVQRDGTRVVFNRVGAPPVPGATFELTIDAVLQHLVERELRAGVEENHAAGGCALVMDPRTGEILASASEPTFDPNDYRLASEDRWRNRAVQDIYEPGSTFKIVTGSAALDEKTMSPTDLIETGNGTIAIGSSRFIRDAQGHSYGTISFTDVLVKSSNVGAVRIGLRLGAERLGRYVERFGFGTRLSPDFRENAGIVWQPSTWNESTLASVSMGYEISVTPLQMAAAASAVANGGELIAPRVVRAVIDGGRRVPVPRKVIRRTTSAETAAEMTSIMEAVVERGTGKPAGLPDFAVAGKTGTAHKNRNGHYLDDDFNLSFVGFVPSRNPALAIIVVIDVVDARRGPNPPFGATVAAPIFRRIADAALRYLGVAPTVNPVAPVVIARRGSGQPMPVAAPAVPITIVPAIDPGSTQQMVVPELRGLSGREALRVLSRLGLTPRLTGEGVVIGQDPLPGSPVEPGGPCRLSLGRLPPGVRP
jgi:cell division protein FtsI (penicillin-binding protein 3)